MDIAKQGDEVLIEYTLKYSNGSVYATTQGRDPVRFEIGSGFVLPGIDRLVRGMAIGDVKTVTLLAKEAFGEFFDELVQTIPLHHVPDHISKVVGQKVEIQQEGLFPLVARISEVTDEHIVIDANPYQAGKSFLLTLELIDLYVD